MIGGRLVNGTFNPRKMSSLHQWCHAGSENVSTGGARQFTAANTEFLSATSNSDLQTGDTDFAFSAWIFPDSSSAVMGIVSKYTGTNSTSEYKIELNTSLNVIVTLNAGGETTKTGSGTLIEDVWNHVVVQHDTGTSVKITINGGTTETIAYTGGNTVYATDFRVGIRTATAQPMDGRIALLGFWKRLLTDAEISQLWNTGRGLAYGDLDAGLKTTLIGFWNLNEASGAAIDQHGSNDLSDNASVTAANGPGAGKSRYYTLANDEFHSLDPPINPGTSDFAICGWFNLADTGTNKQLISCGGGGSGNNGFAIYTRDAQMRLYFVDGVQAGRLSTAKTAGITADAWFFWVWNFDRDGNAQLWVNNADYGTTDISSHAASLDPDEELAIGGLTFSSGTAVEDMNGRICRTMWFTKLLDETARTALYNDGDGMAYADLTAEQKTAWGIYAAWDGDEASGNLIDQHGDNDMTDNNTVTSADGPESPLSHGVVNGDLVQDVTDLSSNEFECHQATAGSKPSWISNGINTFPTLRFDGSADYMTASSISTALSGSDKPFTIISAIEKASNSGTDAIFSLGNTGDANPFHEIRTEAANNYESHRSDDSPSTVTDSGGTPDTDPHIVSVTFTGTAVSIHVDGAVVVDDQAHDVGTMTVNQFAVGALVKNAVSNYFAGDISEWSIYSVAKSAADRNQVEKRLGAKYGVSVA